MKTIGLICAITISMTWFGSAEALEPNFLCDLAMRSPQATIRYPNGQVMTFSAGESGKSWYYSNGQLMTASTGDRGATWYYSNGQMLTTAMGEPGATWYYSNGNIMTFDYSGELFTDQELLYPCTLQKYIKDLEVSEGEDE